MIMAITDRERHPHVVCQRAHRPRRKQEPCAGNEALGHGISLFLLLILLALASSLIAVSYVEGSERQSVEERITQDTGAFRMEDSDAPRAMTSKIPGYETTTALRTIGRLKRESTFIIKERLGQANTKLEEGKDAKMYTASNDEDGNNNVDTNYEESLDSDEDGVYLDKKTGFLRHYQRLILLRSQQKATATAHEEQPPFLNIYNDGTATLTTQVQK